MAIHSGKRVAWWWTSSILSSTRWYVKKTTYGLQGERKRKPLLKCKSDLKKEKKNNFIITCDRRTKKCPHTLVAHMSSSDWLPSIWLRWGCIWANSEWHCNYLEEWLDGVVAWSSVIPIPQYKWNTLLFYIEIEFVSRGAVLSIFCLTVCFAIFL